MAGRREYGLAHRWKARSMLRGTAEQWIKEGKYALNWTRLSCHKFVANQVRNVPANSRQPSPRAPLAVSSVLSCPPAPIADRHWRPQKRLLTERQPPVYPNSSPEHRACNSLTPLHCPHAVHPCPSVDSG